jgi:tetratricopeptide (TPR) repeat protein
LSNEVSVRRGEDFEIFQDRDDIRWGQDWKERIEESIDEVTFLIPIVTPSFFRSKHCRNELKRFLDREQKLGRKDLVLPIYYIDTPLMDDEEKRQTDEMAQAIHSHQYADWRELRDRPWGYPRVRKTLVQLATHILDALERVKAMGAFETPTGVPPVEPFPEALGQEESLLRYREYVESIWADKRLNRSEVGRMNDRAEELGLSASDASAIEHEVMGETKEAMLEREERLIELYAQARQAHAVQEWQEVVTIFNRIHAEDPAYPDPERLFDSARQALDRAEKEQDALRQYHEAVQLAWADRKLSEEEVERLGALTSELGLSLDATANIEREVMDDTVQAILRRQSREDEEHQRHVEELYDQGLRYMDAREWQQALVCLEEVQRLEPGYGKVEEWLSWVRQKLASPPKVKIPDLGGQEVSQASTMLANRGLKLGAQNRVPDDAMPKGKIIKQSPEAGREAEADSLVSITVSSGPQPVLPALAGSWWALFLRGLVLAIFGLALLVMPTVLNATGNATGSGYFRLVSAIVMILDWVFATIDAQTRASRRRWLLIQGRIGFLLGLFTFVTWLPFLLEQFISDTSSPSFVKLKELALARYLVGSWAIVIGIFRIAAALQLRWETKNLLLMGASGVLLIFFGMGALLLPASPFWWSPLGYLALASGITLIAFALVWVWNRERSGAVE